MSQRDTADADLPLPLATRHDAVVQGHWLLARLGKRVLRPGGAELTHKLLALADVPAGDVVELAPGRVAPQPKSSIADRIPMWESSRTPTPPHRSGPSCLDTATSASPTRQTPGYLMPMPMLSSAKRC